MNQRRVHAEGTYAHYVTYSCCNRRKLLSPDLCKRIVLGCLSAQLKRQNAICIGFVLMPDHAHALVWFPEEHQISEFMNKWKELTSSKIAAAYTAHFPSYSKTFSADDPVWQKRYHDFNIFSDAKLREKLQYMHDNPVRAGLVDDPCDWPWSSARFWLLGKPVGVPVGWPP